MPGYKIVESVGAGVQPVNKWSDIEHHHPSNKLQEDGRVYAKVNGKAEEVAGNYSGAAAYSPGGQLMVSKDFVLKNADNNSSNVPVPSPANGYIGQINKSNGTVTILDRPGGEVMFQLRHMKIDESIKPGTKVEYGQPLGMQSGYGKGDPGYYGTHLHIDANAKYLDQADRYVRDIASGAITTDKRPANTTNIVNATPTIEHISGKFPAPPKQALADGKIEFGENGPDVALLQEKLRAADARDAQGRVNGQDGDFGNGTKQALENYQKAHNLPATGIADQQTLTRLGVIDGQQQTPTPTKPAPTQPAPTQPAPTQPAPAQPAPAQEELSPPALCPIDCRDAMPRNEAMAARLEWRQVQIGPVPGDPVPSPARSDNAAFVDRLLEAAGRGDGTAVSRISQDHLQSDAGQAWLQSGRERLHHDPAPVHVPEQVERSHQPEALAR